MDRCERRPAEPNAVTRDIQAASSIDQARVLKVGAANQTPERGSGVLRELAELTCHWD